MSKYSSNRPSIRHSWFVQRRLVHRRVSSRQTRCQCVKTRRRPVLGCPVRKRCPMGQTFQILPTTSTSAGRLEYYIGGSTLLTAICDCKKHFGSAQTPCKYCIADISSYELYFET